MLFTDRWQPTMKTCGRAAGTLRQADEKSWCLNWRLHAMTTGNEEWPCAEANWGKWHNTTWSEADKWACQRLFFLLKFRFNKIKKKHWTEQKWCASIHLSIHSSIHHPLILPNLCVLVLGVCAHLCVYLFICTQINLGIIHLILIIIHVAILHEFCIHFQWRSKRNRRNTVAVLICYYWVAVAP